MIYLVVILLFLTLWVVIICVVATLSRRRTPLIMRSGPRAFAVPPALPGGIRSGGSCCLEVPCSAACAAEHQRMRKLLEMDHGRVAAELRKFVGEIGGDLTTDVADGAYHVDLDR